MRTLVAYAENSTRQFVTRHCQQAGYGEQETGMAGTAARLLAAAVAGALTDSLLQTGFSFGRSPRV